MSDLSTIPTREMNQEQWTQFRKEWVADYAWSYEQECGMTQEDSVTIAEHQWEEYCGQEGWTGRDERIYMSRE